MFLGKLNQLLTSEVQLHRFLDEKPLCAYSVVHFFLGTIVQSACLNRFIDNELVVEALKGSMGSCKLDSRYFFAS